MKVGIIGGGIAGLSTALALKKAGIAFHLFEQSPAFREVGAGILLSTSTQLLLEKLGVGNEINNFGEVVNEVSYTNTQLKKFFTLPVTPVGISIQRAKLIKVLSSPLEATEYTLNARIEQVQQFATKTKVVVANTEYEFDVIIAADGIHSPIRKQLLPLVNIRYTQQTMWRGITKIALPERFSNSMLELWGLNKRIGIMHLKDGSYFWYAVSWQKEGKLVNEHSIKSDLLKLFEKFDTIVHQLIDECDHIITTELYDLPQDNFAWYNHRVVFVGDAIHACTPHIAQGACQSIESAYTLAACLNLHKNDLHAAFTLYQQKRKAKVNFICNSAFEFGRFSHQRKNWQNNLLHTIFSVLPKGFIKYKFNQTTDLRYLAGLTLE